MLQCSKTWLAALALHLAACTTSTTTDDAAVGDGGLPGIVCTTPACAVSPCAPGCTFTPFGTADAGACADGVPILTSKVTRCPGFCGLAPCADGGGD